MSARILIVDPSPQALDSYQEALVGKRKTWQLMTAQSEKAALEMASQQAPDITIVAFKLNDGQGLATLSRLVDAAPLTHPFIVAAESDKDKLSKAFEGGCRYLPEDCPTERLVEELRKCLAIDNWFDNPTLKELFADHTRFRLLPPSYLRVLELLNAQTPDATAIAEAVACDMVLSAKVLEVVNGSYHGFSDKVSDIKQAVSLIGLDAVRHILLITQLFSSVGESSQKQALLEEIWHHSLSVAVAAQRITLFETGDKARAAEAYSAGLLHDVGKLVLLDSDAEAYSEAQRDAVQRKIPAWKAEQELLGCDHAETGAYLLHRWGLPEGICQTTALHHRPANSCQLAFTTLTAVHAANAITRRRRNAAHSDAKPYTPYLEETGQSEKWEDWEAVAAGKEAPSQQSSKLSLSKNKPKQEAAPIPAVYKQPERDQTTKAAQADLARSLTLASELREERAKRSHIFNRRGAISAFAAGAIATVVCIHFLNTMGEDDEKFPIPEASASETEDKPGSYLSVRNNLLKELVEDKPKAGHEGIKAVGAADSKRIEHFVEQEEPEPPPPPPPPPFPEIKLGAIFIRTTGSKAQINGKILGIGDRVEEAVIKEIHRTSIVVEHYGREKQIHLD